MPHKINGDMCCSHADYEDRSYDEIVETKKMTKDHRTSPMQDFLEKFFELCKDYQQFIPPHKMAEVLRDYADRLD